ncbi:MAG: hypothetical protein AB8B55_01515 [Mariniblastus sp.]
MKTYVTIVFGLFVIWTGLLRCIEAQAFKPNAFYFCLTMGIIALAAGFVFRLGREKTAIGIAVVSGGIVLAFYLYCLIVQPEKDANVRVAMVIVASFAQLTFMLLPNKLSRKRLE